MSNSAHLLAPPLPHTVDDRIRWSGLGPGADALALAAAARTHDSLLLVVASDTREASRLEAEIRYFLDRESDPEVLHFPDWETLAYDSFSPQQDIVSQRLSTLQRLPDLKRGVLVAPITTLIHRIVPVDWLVGRALVLDVGDRFDLDTRKRVLQAAGYRRVETVFEHGEYAIRGALMDLFPMGSAVPYRIDLFDDEIESLRTFDPETQRSLEQVNSIRLLPAREFPLDADAIRGFRDRWHQSFSGDPHACPIYQDICQGTPAPGIEYYLPLFFGALAALTDYLPESTAAVFCGDPAASARSFRDEVLERYENLRFDRERPLLPPESLFLEVDELFVALGRFGQVRLRDSQQSLRSSEFRFEVTHLPHLELDARSEHPAAALLRYLRDGDEEAARPAPQRVLFSAESPGRREVLTETLQRAGVNPHTVESFSQFLDGDAAVGLCIAPLEAGFGFTAGDVTLAVIPETVLLGEHVRQQRRRQRAAEAPEAVIRNLSELRKGAPVVHLEHGVGRYLGLETMDVGEHRAEFLTLEYANGARLYVPVANLHVISRYTGADPEQAPLHRLGSDQWEKAKRKAAEKVRDVAAELLDIHARRASRTGFGFAEPDEEYARFAAAFPFEETPDQESAVAAVIADMVGTEPMDRLVCGDVGFGKTEVAMRAAFIAVQSGKQVAVLVPTTLLAQQHFETFSDRFADWPVKIEVLSRFRSGKEMTSVAERLAAGKVDIVIGTHKLLSREFRYRDLGLVIVDEEHRFGVRQKEQLKALRAEVDLLTLTATPIPRTLNMAMHELRELSIIATPPPKRLSIRTFVRRRSDGLLKEAILRELLRGGQVFYVHNEVRTIERTAAEIEALIPEARVAIGHGQMRERELEQVMSDFYHRRCNVLVCTTIIETGIDIPNANTIVIDRADRFGLAQMHQLRGRVGRSNRQAYAYLLTPDPKAMTDDAKKRLEAIEAAGELGVGFSLATHDLEIRGAGELLGDDQSGQMQAIGFSLYMEMLDRAVKAIRAGKEPSLSMPLGEGIEVDLHLPALIPDDYLPDVHTRLVHYKRIANAEDADALTNLQAEMVDRFGRLPPQVVNLFRVTEIKLLAQHLGVTRVDFGESGGRVEFGQDTTVDPMRVIELVQSSPDRYRFDGGNRLRLILPLADTELRLRRCRELLEQLGAGPAPALKEVAHG
ncbi:MAG: transcription-repair coupling factor [Gammaproteobacteria bacterium]|nr:transcription-repair coupling factor [Gammaproteobacteria bacterium]